MIHTTQHLHLQLVQKRTEKPMFQNNHCRIRHEKLGTKKKKTKLKFATLTRISRGRASSGDLSESKVIFSLRVLFNGDKTSTLCTNTTLFLPRAVV